MELKTTKTQKASPLRNAARDRERDRALKNRSKSRERGSNEASTRFRIGDDLRPIYGVEQEPSASPFVYARNAPISLSYRCTGPCSD